MKKNILLLFLYFSVGFVSAQELRWGVKAGGNYSDINSKDLPENSHRYKLGWHAGIVANYQLTNPAISIQPELLYSRKGFESNSDDFPGLDDNGNTATFRQSGFIRFNYVELPVMFTYRIGILVFEIGPQISYLAGMRDGSNVVTTYPDGSVKTESIAAENKITETDITQWDAGFATGMRFETEKGAGLGFRFNQGFVPLLAKEEVVKAITGYNQVFQVYASFLIPR